MAALRADGFARLKGYDGRARVRVYTALVVRDLLSERVVKLLALDADARLARLRGVLLRRYAAHDPAHAAGQRPSAEPRGRLPVGVRGAAEERPAAAARLFGPRQPVRLHPARHREPGHRLRAHHRAAPAPSGRDPAPGGARSVGLPPALLGAARARSAAAARPPAARRGAACRRRRRGGDRPRPRSASARLSCGGHGPGQTDRHLGRRRGRARRRRRGFRGADAGGQSWSTARRPGCWSRRWRPCSRRCLGSTPPNAYICNWRSPASRRGRSRACSACRSRPCTSSRKR